MDEAGALRSLALAPASPKEEEGVFPVRSWLERAETIGAAYQAWEALRSQYKAATQSHAQKSASLRLHGEFVLGAAQQAQAKVFGENAAAPTALSSGARFVEQSRQHLSELSQMWADAQTQMRRSFEQASQEIEQEIVRRVDRTLQAAPPKLCLTIHYLSQERCVLQFERIDELTSVLLSRLISGKVPTHYAFLFDDSVSQAGEAAEVLYENAPTEGPAWACIVELLEDKERQSAPWKGQIPLAYEGEVLWTLKQKGAVMEVEQAALKEAKASAVLEMAKAQWIVAHFFRWMHEGKAELTCKVPLCP